MKSMKAIGTSFVVFVILSLISTVGQVYKAFSYDVGQNNDIDAFQLNQQSSCKSHESCTVFESMPLLAKNESFGACLMIKEDNQLLPEFLAFHYVMLPLRYVFVGSDLDNHQDPREVLERWSMANTGLHYWLVNSSGFMFRHGERNVVMKNAKNNSEDAHHSFIHRQRAFITTCSEFLKKEGIHWVTYIDSDEFIVMNRLGEDELATTTRPGNLGTSKGISASEVRKALPTLDSHATVLDAINDLEVIRKLGPCVTMPRLLHGSLENLTCPRANAANQLAHQEGFDYLEMSTLRFTQHARKGDFALSKFGKVMMDVSELSNATVVKSPRNIHRPFKPECGPGVTAFDEAPFCVNHYIGSWERYSSRHDARRSRHEWAKRAFITTASSCDKAVFEWFPRFVNAVGLQRSKFLLASKDAHGKMQARL